MKRKKTKIMNKVVKVLKKIKLRNLIILLILLIVNTFAWFIYATRVSLDLSVHVSSWNVEFVSGDEEITTNIEIVLDRIYPGMEEFERVIEVFGFSASVMGTDKIDDGFWQHCFFCDLDTVVHMIDNDFRALVER